MIAPQALRHVMEAEKLFLLPIDERKFFVIEMTVAFAHTLPTITQDRVLHFVLENGVCHIRACIISSA